MLGNYFRNNVTPSPQETIHMKDLDVSSYNYDNLANMYVKIDCTPLAQKIKCLAYASESSALRNF
jgi:hypothetical protein